MSSPLRYEDRQPRTSLEWFHDTMTPRRAGDNHIIRDERGGIICEVADGPDAAALVALVVAAPALLRAARVSLDRVACRSHSHSNSAGCFHCAGYQDVRAALVKAGAKV